jgi:outer membrane protein W
MIFSLGVNYHFLHEGKARPYIGIGGSYISSKMEFVNYFDLFTLEELELSEESVSTFGFYFKGGLDYLVSESIAVFGEARYALALEEEVPQPWLSEIEMFEDEVVNVDLGGFSATFGVKFRF